MKPLTYSRLAAVLRRHGYVQVEARGSHFKWRNAAGRSFPVPRHGNAPLKPGTLLAIARQSGIDKSEFEKA